MMLLKCCTQFVSKFGKLSSGHRTGKGQSSPQFPRRAKECSNYCTIAFISHAYAQNPPNLASAVYEPRTSRWTSWVLKRQRNQRSNCQHPLDHGESKRVPKIIYFCFIDYSKAFDCVDHNKL